MPHASSRSPRAPAPPARAAAPWTFLTNHAHVLVCLADDPALRLRDVAARVGITERAVQLIVADLEAGGVLTRERDGRRNRYALYPDRPLRHQVEGHCSVRDLLELILPLPAERASEARPVAVASAARPRPRGNLAVAR